MTLSYTRRLHLAIPDFNSEPWHAEFADAMESIDAALYSVLVEAGTELWETNHAYVVGDRIIDPQTGTLYAAAVDHTSSRPTFAEELAAFPTYWTSFAVDIATQDEAEQGIENTHYMTPLRVAQAIDVQSPTPSIATQPQAEEGSDNATLMTPLRTVQQIDARVATQVEAEAGTDNRKLMTPLRVSQAIDALGLPGGSQVAFSAHKNAVNQIGIASTVPTKVTFGTELYDLGNFYDTANSRWTPPAGNCHIDGKIHVLPGSLTVGTTVTLSIYKNGVVFKTGQMITQTTENYVDIGVDDVGNATDYYELYVTLTGTGSIDGIATQSYFTGHFLGDVSTVVLGHAEIGFRAWKNGAAQTLSAIGTDQKVTFGTEIFDQGGYYEPSTSRWTPPTGMVHITARIGTPTSVASNWFRSVIYKNGAPLAIGYHVAVSADGTQVDVDDVASGTDYYEAFALSTAGGTLFADLGTYFCGHRVGGPQGDPGIAGPTGPSGTVSGIVVPPQGRLTLLSNTPVMTISTTGVSTIRYTPYMGNRIPIFDGSGMVMVAFTELSQLLSDSAKSPAAALPESAYDMFVWVDAGVVRVSRGPVWDRSASVAISSTATSAPAVITWVNHGLHEGSMVVFSTTGTLPTGITAGTIYYVGRNVTATTFSVSTTIQNAFVGTYVNTVGTTQSGAHTGTNRDASRGTGTGTTELARVQGMLVNAFGISHGPVANQGTYVGTIRTNAVGTVDWQYGTRAVGGGTASHNVWNCYNRKEVQGTVAEAANTWTPELFNAWRALKSNTNHRVNAMFGLAEEPMEAFNGALGLSDHLGGWLSLGVAFDSTSINVGIATGTHVHTGNVYSPRFGAGNATAMGHHYLQATEFANWSGGTQPFFYGNAGIGDQGMTYKMIM
jgi:hypothetical protein